MTINQIGEKCQELLCNRMHSITIIYFSFKIVNVFFEDYFSVFNNPPLSGKNKNKFLKKLLTKKKIDIIIKLKSVQN